MNEIIISSLSEELMDETVKFISSFQSVDENFVAWLGYSPEEIRSQLGAETQPFKERCLIAVDRGVVCGFLGIHLSEEHSIARLLGPYVSLQKNWSDIALDLLKALKAKIPAHFSLVKVAFYAANVNCKQLYATNHFALYNAEKTLMLNSKGFTNSQKVINKQINFRSYQPTDYDKFIQIHPTAAYFTGAEVISRLNQYHRLVVAELDNCIIGYVYFEMLLSDGFAEICFLNVSPEFRNRSIGSLLMSEAVNEAFKLNWINHIEISVRVNNEGAERLYLRTGFKEKNVVIALQRDLNLFPWGDFT
ncbi:MAG TPA: GNAT family N-acetyltransferase [Desulfosporosinus sp.]|jgi:ribosomal protein S18 acetylase RimI-like enzyme|nr:GNAT family N-acetyltransferase [Desulfosporosinus sp.]